MDNLNEMGKFLEIYDLPKINHEGSENLNRQITSSETEAVIKKKKIPTNNSLGPDDFTGKFYQMFWEELTPLPLKIFQNTQGG